MNFSSLTGVATVPPTLSCSIRLPKQYLEQSKQNDAPYCVVVFTPLLPLSYIQTYPSSSWSLTPSIYLQELLYQLFTRNFCLSYVPPACFAREDLLRDVRSTTTKQDPPQVLHHKLKTFTAAQSVAAKPPVGLHLWFYNRVPQEKPCYCIT
jgi:hypothetical protein